MGMIPADSVLPPELMHAGKRREVIGWLRQAALPARDKSKILRSWATQTGEQLRATDYGEVEATGIDR